MKSINQETMARAIDARVNDDVLQGKVRGASLLVEQAGEVKYRAHFGVANAQGDAVCDKTLFRLASMTKPITAVAAMILVDRGLLSLEDVVDHFYPKFSRMKVYNEGVYTETTSKITVKQLLTHTSGIGSISVWDTSVTEMTDEDNESVDRFLDFLSEQPLSFVPGTSQEYSGVGAFSVLTGIIQKITDMPYNEFLKKEIFDPCHMTETTFEPTAEQWGRVIEMHDRADDQSIVGWTRKGCVFENIPPHNYLGGAGLLSCLDDYLNFARMLLNGGVFDGKRIVSEEAIKQISTPHVFNRTDEWWGLGVRVITEHKPDSLPIGAYGWSGAYGTHFWVDPINRIVGVYMKNSRYDGGAGCRTSQNFENDVYASLRG